MPFVRFDSPELKKVFKNVDFILMLINWLIKVGQTLPVGIMNVNR